MSRELFILRHAKSDWDSGASKDSERPLNKRGSKEAPKIGAWMHEQGLMPAQVYCSTAVRARETLQAVAKELRLPSTHIHFMDALYLADLRTLLKTLAEIPPQHTSAMLVGHNPGLDELVMTLAPAIEAPISIFMAAISLSACIKMPSSSLAIAPAIYSVNSFCGVMG